MSQKTSKPSTARQLADEAVDSSEVNPRQVNVLGRLLRREPADSSVTPVTPVTGGTLVTPVTGDAAPKRDFTRTANSIVREAVPAGVFVGKGKQLYDYLYSRTRGAIVPKVSARIPTDDVMKGSGMTRHTFRAHIHRLISLGYVKVEERAGQHGGNVYTVYLPEEIDRGDRGDRGHSGDRGEQLPVVQGSQVDRGDRGVTAVSTDTSGGAKTSIKTKDHNTDDEAAPARLRALERELTGKNSATAAQWDELFDVLAAELRIAASRTTVSSMPAFLAEHLRRRLWKLDKRQATAEGRELPDQAPAVAQSAPQECPDCKGSGWWYPQGQDKGVAKCKHEKLSQGQ